MTTITNALPVCEAHEEWKREHALLESMYAWANDGQEQIDICVEVEGILDGVDDALMTRVLRRRCWYLVPDVSTYPTLQAYIDASYGALAADVRAYKAEVAAA